MADGSIRRGGPTAGPLLLAVIFLAVLGGGVGFSLGTLAKHQRNAADHRPLQITIRGAVLLGEIERALPAAIRDCNRLQRDDDARERGRRQRGM